MVAERSLVRVDAELRAVGGRADLAGCVGIGGDSGGGIFDAKDATEEVVVLVLDRDRELKLRILRDTDTFEKFKALQSGLAPNRGPDALRSRCRQY